MITTLKIEIQKARQNGCAAIKVLLLHKGQRRRLPTGLTAETKDFDKKGKIRNRALIDDTGNVLHIYKERLHRLGLSIIGMNVDRLAALLTDDPDKRIDFFEVFEDFIKENSEKKGIKNYRTALNSFRRFLRRGNLDIAEIVVSMLQAYARTLPPRAAEQYLTNIRCVYNYAMNKYNDEERGRILIPYTPFNKFKPPRSPIPKKRALPVEIIRKIIALPNKPESKGAKYCNRYNLAKDCFLLSFALMGMNSVDMFNATEYRDGVISYCRTKTRDRRDDHAYIEVKVPPQVRELFDKYRDPTGRRVFRFYMIFSTRVGFNKSINAGLKTVGNMVGVDRLQFYAARHSWATIARNDLEIGKDIINDALNHTDRTMAITDIYIKKSFAAINKANAAVVQYVYNEKGTL